MSETVRTRRVWGLLAEFGTPEELLKATRQAYEAGYRNMDAYTPMPIHGLGEALGMRRTGVPPVVLCGGLLGAATGFGLGYFMTAIPYVHNVGSRPVFSWPSYIPITFEVGVLFASFAAVIGMLAMNGLPRPYHAVFNHPRFERASEDRFFLGIEARDPLFELEKTRSFLQSLGAWEVSEVDD
jgi:hypothetical protein